MKKALLILAIVIMASCKTENIYLNVSPVERVTEITDTIYIIPDNRFRTSFQRSDSIFGILEKASKKAANAATFETKHLRP